MTKEIYICRYNYRIRNSRSVCEWLLTDSKEYALTIDPDYQLASLQDLHDWICASSKIFNDIIRCKEGLCKWFESSFIDDCGFEDCFCEYCLL